MLDTLREFSTPLTILLLGLLMLLTGVRLARLARSRKWRVGTEPHCGQCEYILTGINSERCPECGTAIDPRTIRYGTPTRHYGITAAAVLLLVAGLAVSYQPTVGICRAINWYRFKPLSSVFADLQSGDEQQEDRAAKEILRRSESGGMSRGQIDEVAVYTLRRGRSSNRNLIDFLGQQLLAGNLREDQKQQFFKHIESVDLNVRHLVRKGDKVPVRVDAYSESPWFWTARLIPIGANVDGISAPLELGPSEGGRDFCGGFVSTSVDLGTHVLEVAWQMQVFKGDETTGFNTKPENLIFEHKINAMTEFTIVAQGSPQDLKYSRDESLQELMQASIRPTQAALRRQGDEVEFFSFIEVAHDLPKDLAFDVYAQFNSTEFKVGTLRYGRSSNGSGYIETVLPTRPTTGIDIILRANEDLARQSLDLYDVWDGELVYLNVPVRVISLPATRPNTNP